MSLPSTCASKWATKEALPPRLLQLCTSLSQKRWHCRRGYAWQAQPAEQLPLPLILEVLAAFAAAHEAVVGRCQMGPGVKVLPTMYCPQDDHLMFSPLAVLAWAPSAACA